MGEGVVVSLRNGLWRWSFAAGLVLACVLMFADSASAATAYVTNSGGAVGTVTPIEVATNKPGPEIKVGSVPIGVAITPNDKAAYAVNNGSDSVTPIEIATNKPGPEIKVGSGPYAIAITPDGKTAYVTNNSSGSVTPIEIATNKPGPEIKVGSGPIGVAITPDGKAAYVANALSGTVTPIEVATNKPGSEIKVGSSPTGVAIAPNDKTAYVTNEVSGTVTPIEIATNKPGPEIKVGSSPVGVAVMRDGKTAYVVNQGSGTVTPIELATNKPGPEIKVGSAPFEVAITPAVATCTSNTGTIKLSPGLSATAAVQTVKIKGTLAGCTGKAFTETKYKATLTTAAPVSCAVLTGAGEPATGPVKYKWMPKAKASKGALAVLLTEMPGVAFTGEVTSGSYSPLKLSGLVTESYTGFAMCTTKKVKKATFSGSAVNLE